MKIVCPFCGKKLDVVQRFGGKIDDGKMVKCPTCKMEFAFGDAKVAAVGTSEKHVGNRTDTIYPGGEKTDIDIKTHIDDEAYIDPETQIDNRVTGYMLRAGRSNTTLKLKEGKNVIGRKAGSSKATIQIEVNAEKPRLSREHIVVDVVKNENDNDYSYNLSLFKEQMNISFLNGKEMRYGVVYKLNHNDTIELPDGVVLKFYFHYTEVTEIC